LMMSLQSSAVIVVFSGALGLVSRPRHPSYGLFAVT
jgi:hypothetical protein